MEPLFLLAVVVVWWIFSAPIAPWLHSAQSVDVLSYAHRLCSSLRRQSDLEAILESWGPEGREKAVSYLRPLYEDTQQLLWSLKAIDDQP